MITIFTTAKPFTGHCGVIQRNALKSWKELRVDAEVILLPRGCKEVVEGGPKLLRSFFVAQEMARRELICYVNCDIALPRDFLYAVNAVDAVHRAVFNGGRRWNLEVETPIVFAMRDWERRLKKRGRSVPLPDHAAILVGRTREKFRSG